MSRFPAAFRPPAFACRVILFPPGDWAFLTVGLPGALRPDPDGVSTFRTARYDRGGCPLYPGDGGALPARCRARPSPAASQRPVPAPRTRIPPAGLRFTRHQRGFTRFTRPACPSPVTTRMGPAVLGLSPVLRTPPLPATHHRAGPGVSTRPELRGRHNRPSNPRVHSRSATSCRNGTSGCSLQEPQRIDMRAGWIERTPKAGWVNARRAVRHAPELPGREPHSRALQGLYPAGGREHPWIHRRSPAWPALSHRSYSWTSGRAGAPPGGAARSASSQAGWRSWPRAAPW